MEERRKQTTVRQLELMVEYLDEHRDLGLGRLRSKEARAVSARLWREFSQTLNVEGPARTGKEWAKVWNDFKCRVRAKVVSINASHQATGGGPSNAPTLTPLEEKVANILGRDVGPLEAVRQDQFASNDGDGGDCFVVADEPTESPVILLNTSEADQRPEYVVHVQPLPASPMASPTGYTPSLTSPRRLADRFRRVRESEPRRRMVRAPRQASIQAVEASQSSRSALEESRRMILRIEEMRAEAALKNAESFRLISESIDRCSQKYFQLQP